MIDVNKLINEYAKDVTIREYDGYVIVTPPFFHLDSDESICLKLSETEDGRPVITDCGTTMDYLEIAEVNIEKYRAKLDAIKERFFIEESGGVFSMVIPTDTMNTFRKYVGYFIQAVSIIANIDL